MSDEIKDITPHIAAKSDQLNADDLMGGPREVTITRVRKGSSDQPVEIHLAECKPWRACKTSLRILAAAWGTQTSEWVGRRVLLARDPSVRWAGVEVGGIRPTALSHIDGPLTLQLSVSRGKKVAHRIQCLGDARIVRPLDELLADLEITARELDDWLAAGQRPIVSDLSDDQRAKLCVWLDGEGGRIAADGVRALRGDS